MANSSHSTHEDLGRVSLLLSSQQYFCLSPPLALQIELIHDTRHLCSRFQVLKRTAGIKVMSRGFSGGKQTKNLPVQDLFYQIIGGSGFVVFWM